MPVEHVDITQQRFYIAVQPAVFCLGLDDHVTVPGIEVEFAVGAGKVIQFAQLDAGGAKPEFEVVEITERVEGGTAFYVRIPAMSAVPSKLASRRPFWSRTLVRLRMLAFNRVALRSTGGLN